jgi:tetratricopeptide (TPR) repeat protein
MTAVIEGRDEFLRTIAQLAAERAEAKAIVANLRETGLDVWDLDIPSEWRTAGFVEELTAVAWQILESDPRHSLASAQLALAIATSIPTGTYPSPIQARIEGMAWKEIGTAHRYLGEFDAALHAYDAAQRSLGSANALQHESAVVELARAIVLNELDRRDEALKLLAEIEPILREFGDQRHVVHVRQMTANIYYSQSRFADAARELQNAIPEVPFDDFYTSAALHTSLGLTYGKLGRVEEGLTLIRKGRTMLSELGMTGEVARADWDVGTTLLEHGDAAKAIDILSDARNTFLTLSMTDEAGLSGLDLADALVTVGRFDEARQVIEDVLREFTAKNLNNRAIRALAYLREILSSTTSQPRDAVDHVRKYLKRLHSRPSLLFLPLSEE